MQIYVCIYLSAAAFFGFASRISRKLCYLFVYILLLARKFIPHVGLLSLGLLNIFFWVFRYISEIVVFVALHFFLVWLHLLSRHCSVMSLTCVICSCHMSGSVISESAVLNHVCRSDHVSFHTSCSLSHLLSSAHVMSFRPTPQSHTSLSVWSVLYFFTPFFPRPYHVHSIHATRVMSLPHDIRFYSPYAKRCVYAASRKRRRQQRQAGGPTVGRGVAGLEGWGGRGCWGGRRPVEGRWKRVEGVTWNKGRPHTLAKWLVHPCNIYEPFQWPAAHLSRVLPQKAVNLSYFFRV